MKLSISLLLLNKISSPSFILSMKEREREETKLQFSTHSNSIIFNLFEIYLQHSIEELIRCDFFSLIYRKQRFFLHLIFSPQIGQNNSVFFLCNLYRVYPIPILLYFYYGCSDFRFRFQKSSYQFLADYLSTRFSFIESFVQEEKNCNFSPILDSISKGLKLLDVFRLVTKFSYTPLLFLSSLNNRRCF